MGNIISSHFKGLLVQSPKSQVLADLITGTTGTVERAGQGAKAEAGQRQEGAAEQRPVAEPAAVPKERRERRALPALEAPVQYAPLERVEGTVQVSGSCSGCDYRLGFYQHLERVKWRTGK